MPVRAEGRNVHRAWIAALVAVAAALLLPGIAQAAGKPYAVAIAPGSIAGGDDATLVATITNETATQQLGSADLTVPSALTVRGAAISGPGTVTVDGSLLQLRNLSLAPGGSRSVSIDVSAGCSSGTFGWTVIAKQANDFNGTPGNDLQLDAANSALTTTISGSCRLRFVAQPQDARVNEPITGSDFDPDGPPVSVEVVDGSGARATSSTAPVTVALDPGSPLGGTTTVNAVAGLATFPDLTVAAPGTYTLTATSPGLAGDTSDPFTIAQVAVACLEDVDCSADVSNATSGVSTTAFADIGPDAGFLQLSLDSGFRPDCAGYDEFSADWATVVGPERTKTLTYTIAKTVMNARPNNGASFLQMCFAAPYPFATRPGTALAEVDRDGLPGPDLFVGLLPDCGVAPCVTSRSKTRSGQGVIVVQAPGGSQDPAYRP